jgi:HlyD family secretion protein
MILGRRYLPTRTGDARRGFSYWTLLVVLALLVAIPVVAYSLTRGRNGAANDSAPMLLKVERGEFIHDIAERGELESASNVEIRCEVKAMGYSGTTLLEIVPEGTVVQAGDIVAKLDSSALENDRTRQLIAVANAEADVIKARTTLETAVLAKEEYMRGTYAALYKTVEGDLFVAKENQRRAEEYLEYSKTLKAKGFITSAQLEADTFAVEKAKYDLEAANTKLQALENFTRKKMEKQLDADVEAAEARFSAQQHSYDLERTKLADIENQIAKCTIRAPAPGQVVYANVTNSYNGPNVVIEAGCAVRERQEIIRLPDHTQMQVKAKINEGKIAMVAVGQTAIVRLDAFPDTDFNGVVQHINEYPIPTSRYTSSVKEYETLVRIINPPPGARPGLTAEVRINIEQLHNALQVPVQAILEHGDRHYCVTYDEERGFEPVEVKIGSTNDKFVIVRKGVEEGATLVLNAAALRTKIALPDAPVVERTRPTKEQVAALIKKKTNGPLTSDKPKPRFKSSEESSNPAETFAKLDKNHDGKLQVSELPDTWRKRAKEIDSNLDGTIDRTEWGIAVRRSLARVTNNGTPPTAVSQ